MTSKRIIEILRSGEPGAEVSIAGWVRTKRELKDLAFLDVNDGSSLQGLQVVIEATLPDYEAVLRSLATGASVSIDGILVASQGKNQRVELKAQSLTVWGSADPETYPLQKKRHSFEFLRTIAHLRSRTNTLGAVFRVRNVCSAAIHDFFQSRGFLWAHTPIITTGDCEGAGEQFSVTSFNLNQLPKTPEG
ncbi:MAG TPA: OB-fold nucleic acid binding domain-containing protein, partial [Stenomitos sp.]